MSVTKNSSSTSTRRLLRHSWAIDLAFRHLEPDTYRRIAREVDETRIARERYVENVKKVLSRELVAQGIKAEVSGRPKHIYSIWRKMQKKRLAFDQLYDIRAVRVMVDDVAACYAALGVVHALWAPVPSEFDDYIARPKANDYRSLHTAVVGPEGRTIEVQIRTHEMHSQAELGVAAHWKYKEGGKGAEKSFDRKIDRRRQAGHPVPAGRFLRPPGHHHREPAEHALPRHADRCGNVQRAGHHRRACQHAHRRAAR